MTVYLVLIVFLLFCGIGLKPQLCDQRKKIFMLISFVSLFWISAFRDFSVGADTADYVSIFKYIDSYLKSSSRFERGFLVFLKYVHDISSNPTFMLAVSSAICIGVTCWVIYKYSEDPTLSVLLYILLKAYFFQMTGIRQALATAFILLAFTIVLSKRNVKRIVIGVLLIILAIQFHAMSVVAFIPYLIWITPGFRNSEKVSSDKILGWTLLISVGGFVFYPLILRLVTMVFPQYVHYFAGTWGDSNYVASLFKMLILLSFLVVGAIYLHKKELTELDRLCLLMGCISVIVATLSMRMEIWGRLTGMFSIYTSILFAPAFCSRAEDRRNRIILKSSIFIFSFAYMFVTFIFRPEWDGVVPYIFR